MDVSQLAKKKFNWSLTNKALANKATWHFHIRNNINLGHCNTMKVCSLLPKKNPRGIKPYQQLEEPYMESQELYSLDLGGIGELTKLQYFCC